MRSAKCVNNNTILHIALGLYLNRLHLPFIISFICSDNRVRANKNFRTDMHFSKYLGSRIDICCWVYLWPMPIWIRPKRNC